MNPEDFGRGRLDEEDGKVELKYDGDLERALDVDGGEGNDDR